MFRAASSRRGYLRSELWGSSQGRIRSPRTTASSHSKPTGPVDMDIEASAAAVQCRVLSVIRNILRENAIVADVHPETRLVDIGLDSMNMVALMLGVEAEFNITLPQPEITPENFESVRSLKTMILKLGPMA